jgi:hypothetical protein
MVLSEHAAKRMQQRGIPEQVIDWLVAYGEIDHQQGAEPYFFSKRSRRALARDVSARLLRRFDKALDAYLVCAEGRIATVGHRYQRVARH